MSTVAIRQEIEKDIAGRIVDALLEAGFKVSVCDGEAFPVKKSTSWQEIQAGMFSTDEDTLVAYGPDGKRFGSVQLVYGNDGWDVISDYSVCMAEVLKPVTDYVRSISP